MKKLFTVLLAALLIPLPAQGAIYDSVTERTITKGITHQSIDTFTEAGWQKADVIRIDLTDENLKLKVMTSSLGTSRVSTVKAMAEEHNTKVAVNADFFNLTSGETNMLGMVYQDGKLISTPSKDNFVSFAITEDNRVFFDYFTFSGTLYAENTSLTENASCELYQINKVPVTTGAITMITSAWGEAVTIPEYNYAMVCEPYEEDKYKMTAFSWGGEKVTIPPDGAVFIANYSVNGFLNLNFAIGDVIRVEASVSPDTKLIREASGGNTLLVRDGEIAEFTSNIAGKAQRTAMGLFPSGNTLVLVTVDGRQEDCAGFTQTEMAEFMIALGCSDAINLDGGGSTTLVTPDLFTGEQTIQNEVSLPRKVSTAIGVISAAEPGEAVTGEMKLSKDTILLGDSVDVTAIFFDENHNNASIDLSRLQITCSDTFSIVDNNRVMPTTHGTHTIYAEYGDIVLEKEIEVLNDIFAINIYPEKVSTVNKDASFTVTAYDKNGKAVPVPQALLTFDVTGELVMDGNTVKAGDAKGTVTAKYESLTSSAVVNGEKYELEADIRLTDTFEGYIEDGEKITITGAIETPVNLLGKLQVRERLKDLSTRGDVYALSDSIYDPWGIFTIYRKTNGFTQRTIGNTKIVTIANSDSSSIRLSETNAWSNLKVVCDNIQEKNLLLITNEPVYNMNTGEQRVWDYYMALLTEKGINVFVVSMGEKSEVTVKNSVRYIYLGAIGDSSIASYDYMFTQSKPLTFTFFEDEIKYTFD